MADTITIRFLMRMLATQMAICEALVSNNIITEDALMALKDAAQARLNEAADEQLSRLEQCEAARSSRPAQA